MELHAVTGATDIKRSVQMNEVHVMSVEHKENGDIELRCQQCERHIMFVKVSGQSSLSLRKIEQGEFYTRHEVEAAERMFNPIEIGGIQISGAGAQHGGRAE